MRSGQFFIITAVLIAGALLTITTIISSSETIDYNTVLESHSTAFVENLGETVDTEWWDVDWRFRKRVSVTEESGSYLENASVPIVLDARRVRVNDTCADIRVVIDGESVPWENTTSCAIDTYDTTTGTTAAGWWKMDEGSGQYANDTTDSSNHGILGGSTSAQSSDPTWVTGRYGFGLDFDGSDDYVGLDAFDISGMERLTAIMWVRPDTVSSSAPGHGGASSGDNEVLWLAHDGDALTLNLGNSDEMYAYVDPGSNGGSGTSADCSVTSSSSPVQTGEWQMLTAVWNGTELKIYHDTDLLGSCSSGNESFASDGGGQLSSHRDGGNNDYFDGRMDDVRIYDRALTASQIEGIYQDGIGLNISVDLAPMERQDDIAVYYGKVGALELSFADSALQPPGVAEPPQVVGVGPPRSQEEIMAKMQRYINDLDTAVGQDLGFVIRDNDCNLVTLRTTTAVLQREAC